MADYDPNRLDPNRPDYRQSSLDTGPGMNWNWILGGIAVVVVLLIALSYMGGDSARVADTPSSPSSSTTGQGAGQGIPRTAPSTTGQSTPSPSPSPTAPAPAPKQ